MTKRLFTAVAALVLALGSTVIAADKKKAAPVDSYAELYGRYLEAARRQPAATTADPSSWMNSLMLDQRARRINDLITVRVIESISGSGTADSMLSKQAGAAVAIPGLFGLDKKMAKITDPANLVGMKHDTSFKGAGATTRASDLTATMGARVAEVLPNGDLVIEGVRELDINGERQIVVLSGVARVADIAPGNVVFSTTLGQLSIKYFGSGLMKDSLSPGWLIRVLNKMF